MKKFKLTKGIQIILLTLLILVIGAIIVEITFNNRSSAATRACGDSNCSGTMSCTNTGVGTHRWGCNVCSYIETGSCSGGSWYHKSGTSVHQKFCWACGYYYTQESCYDDDGDGSCDAGCGNDDMHTHSYTTTYEQYNDTQHKVIKTCSCGDTQETTESHTQKTQAAVAATCTTTGKTEGKYCSVCNQVIVAQETIKALGHTEAIDAAVAATCTTAGKTEGKHCSVCNEVIVAQETIKALGHDYEETVTSPTCTEKGYTTHNCTRCEDSYIDTYTDELGHSFTNYESDNNATCKADGTKTAKCDRCDETDTITDEGSKLQHTEETITGKAATCEETGLTEGTKCAECGEILTAQQEIPALGHEYEDTVTNPTCTEKGYTTHNCTRCGDSYIDTYTDALGHSFTNYESDNNATCKADGTKTAKCDRCDETDTITDEGSKLQHTVETIAGKTATCEETGLTEGTKCTVCEEILVEQEIIPALGHTEVVDVRVEPTCIESGLTEGKHCSECQEILVEQEVIPALGHNYENGKCTVCGRDQYQQIEITSEKYEIDDDYISNIQPGTSVNEFKSNIETTATEIKIYNQDDEEINDDEKIGTGMRIELKNGDKTATYMIIVKGDTNGDGVANINDIFSINSHRLGVKLLTGVYLQAADVNNDGNVEVKDIFKINSYRLRGGEL